MIKHLAIALLVTTCGLSAMAQEQDSTLCGDKMIELMEVVVKGHLPNTRLKGNAIVTRIEGTPLAASGTIGEMLIKVPGMTGTEDNPQVLGKGSPLIYINGQIMRDDSELKRLRSEDIRDVEVINNPGAQYDATVRAVVRIRTRRQQGDGVGINLALTDEQDLRYGFNTPNGKLSINYRKNNVDVFGSIFYRRQNYHQYSWLEETTSTSKVFHQEGPYTMTWKNNQLVYTAGANWQINDNHSVGVRADMTHFLGGTNMVIYDEDIFENDAFIDHLYSEQTSKETKPLGILTNAYYNGKAGKLGIDFNFDFMSSGTDTDRENVEKSPLSSELVKSASGTRSHLYATKLVLSYPVWKGSFEVGTEMTFVKRHSTYWIDKPTIPNTDADIKEDNLAAFAQYSVDFERWGQASVGLRYEHTLFDYKDVSNNDFLHRNQDEFFPTASYSVSVGLVNLSLAYSFKTNRPIFFAMNDAVTYISRYSMQAGNSQLLNERIQDLTFNARWRWLTFTTSYSRCKNAITQWSFVSDDDAVLIKHINLDKPVNTYSMYISANPQVGLWSLNASAGFDKQDFFLDLQDPNAPGGVRRETFNKPIFNINAFNTFSFKHDWRIDVNLMFRSCGHTQNFYDDYNNVRLSVVLQKSFCNKALTLRAAVTDILQRNHMNEYGDMGFYKIQQNNRYSTHKFQFTLLYRFNVTPSKYRGTGAGKDAQQRMKN